MRNVSRIAIAIFAMTAAADVYGQSTNAALPMPPVEEGADRNSVDLRTGVTNYSQKQISIGREDSLLERDYRFDYRDPSDSFEGVLSGDARWASGLGRSFSFFAPFDGAEVCVPTPGAVNAPLISNHSCTHHSMKLIAENGAQASESVDARMLKQNRTIVDESGVIYSYEGRYMDYVPSTYNPEIYGNQMASSGKLVKVTFPNGMIIDINYLNKVVPGLVSVPVISSVVSNFGYMLKYEYGNPSSSDTMSAVKLKKITAINLAHQYCDPFAPSCTVDSSWPTWSYDRTYGTYILDNLDVVSDTVTNALNATYTITAAQMTYPSGRKVSRAAVPYPNGTMPPSPYSLGYGRIVNGPGEDDCSPYSNVCTHFPFTVDAGHGVYKYESLGGGTGSGVKVTSPTGGQASYAFTMAYFSGAQKISSFVDENGRTTSYEYSPPWGKLSKIIYPEGNQTRIAYDSRGNPVERRDVAKPGSGLADRVWSAAYPSTCSNSVICNKPLWTRDPNGGQTDFTYDPVHGGVLTETAPADASGIRPAKTYQYSALRAKVMNAGGVLTESAAPIYRLTRVSQCITGSSCAGTANEQVILYDYNDYNLLKTSETNMAGNANPAAASSPQNLWTRISYTYDKIGNLIVVDGPRTDIDDRAYTTFDALRRPVFEITPDPDGSGSLPRKVTRHVYDADGNEIRTEFGRGHSTDGSDFAVNQFERYTFDPVSGLRTKKEVFQP